ncbi:MAG: hypothetical protein LUP94_01245 [Candidatus Methanomethylicus sp.]|nr:hypothetical protein [Candidatus Methanomethylicus sp.]
MQSLPQFKRLHALDALRGIAVLLMIPTHLFVFGGGTTSIFGEGGSSQLNYMLPIYNARPWGTGLLLFFFVTGVALATVIASKRGIKPFSGIAKREIIRYSSYILLGAVTEFLVYFVIYGQTDLAKIVQRIFGLSFLSVSQPIIGLGFSAIISLPLIYKLSWRKLLPAALAMAVVEGLILLLVTFPNVSSTTPSSELWGTALMRMLFAAPFAIFKGIPIVLYGAAMGGLLKEKGTIKKIYFVIAGIISIGFILVPAVVNMNFWHMIFVIWSYPLAMPFIAASCLFCYGLFTFVEAKGRSISIFQVLGRNSLIVYYGHFIFLLILITVLGAMGYEITIQIMMTEMFASTIAIWIIAFFYSKWRWGDPKNW